MFRARRFGILAAVGGQTMSNIPISEASQALLCELALKTGQTPTEVLDKAVAAYRRRVFFDQMDAGYAELRRDAQAWASFEKERMELDKTLMDGLDADERWTDDGACLPSTEDTEP